MRPYLVAPAGTPISARELLLILAKRLRRGDHERELLRKMGGDPVLNHCSFLNSGKSALSVLLAAMRGIRGSEKDEVILPAYTCYSVAAASVRAGLKIRLVDVDPQTLDFRLEELADAPSRNVLAVVGCNLFGVLNDWEKLNQIADTGGYMLIDDGAQSLGVTAGGKHSGAMGTAGFYSLGRGKPMTSYNGGILITSHVELARALEATTSKLPRPGLVGETSAYLKLALYALFIRPRLYWLPASLPFLGIGETTYDPAFKIQRLSTIQTEAASVLFDRLKDYRDARLDNASWLAKAILSMGKFEILGWDAHRCPPYLRLPVLAPDQATRDSAIRELRRVGIVATRMYPTTIRDIPGIAGNLVEFNQEFSGAQVLVDRLFTIPTHTYLSRSDLDRIVACLRAA